ncbi:pectinesterase-like [Anthonomus grandis grandis]|uniref:pectinesterase-like n=1 Tax=Anthonomus grandis grandis TaxID=2921223 RepID=UPI002165CD72|nr:pectinesterase-like [Anthonomus grandis grandis]
MLHQALLAILLVSATYGSHQTYPGTTTRPILSDAEAALYTKEIFLNGWSPGNIQTTKYDYLVGSDGYSTIQEAVNAAINDGGTTRKYIKVEKGTYKQAVLIPKTTVPITIYGTPNTPTDVHIILSQSAAMTGSDYATQVNPDGTRYQSGDPAWSMYNYCASKETIGTACSAVFYSQNDLLEVAYITVENPSIAAQAVAVSTSGDKVHWDNVYLYGFQDTLYVGGSGRIYVNKATIKGDVDFIFGSAIAIFESAQIISRDDRPRTTSVVFAPNTPYNQKYGMLVINSNITADSGIEAKKGCSLARGWVSSSTANGQVIIRETEIADVINVDAPYTTDTGGNSFSGNIDENRNLDDTSYNRFWEYKNTGSGA